MKICIIGLGYIGLPTALMLSKSHNVFGCDTKEEIVENINGKNPPFIEPGLEEMLKKSNLRAFTHPVESDVFIICVPTLFNKEVKMADLKYVKRAIEEIVPYLRKENLIIIESTITPGTCEKIVTPLLEKSGLRVNKDIYLSHCPERAMPGNTFYEIIHNNRVVGGSDDKSADLAEELYKSFVKGTIYKTSIRTAEFVKLMENTTRDVNIALVNEFAILAEEIGINVREAIELANKHPRVNLLTPGPGVGGHCIAVDPWFLTESTVNTRIINTAREINDGMPRYILSKAKKIFVERNIKDPTVTIFGVAYKGNVDDTRETPALKLIKLCEKEGWNVKVYDPCVKEFEYPLLPLEEAIRDTDLIIVETDHTEFKNINAKMTSNFVRNKNIIDTRNIMNCKEFLDEGFEIKILGIGKGN
ncbi:MAG TPA: UDP-N-acetyl-D-mannosamine dehydrogenase [Desulfotomaculum sp.]|nr:UDP-N-acetyl-D-mannosamine dehydrogenase [Desulfotomaculum sp.]